MANDKFERIEKKFWMSAEQFRELDKVLAEHMKADEYAVSVIRNIYCDTDDYALTRRSIESPPFKEKLRIRCYSSFSPDADVFVEIKRKVAGVGYKRRIEVSFDQAKLLLEGKEIECNNRQIERELHEFINRYHPKPKVYLTYERTALVCKDDPGLRITLDRNIRYRVCDESGGFGTDTEPVMDDESRVLMEVKAPGFMPMWLIETLSRLKIYHSSFSKIGTCFTKFIAPELKFSEKTEPAKLHVPEFKGRGTGKLANPLFASYNHSY